MGITGLQAFLRLIRRTYSIEETIDKLDILYALGFLAILLKFAFHNSRLTPDDGLPLLAFSPKPEGFAGSFLNQFCPGFSLEEDGIDKDLFDIL
jgi:hypothetical protein